MGVQAHITKDGRKVWWFRFRLDGKEYERSTNQGDRKVAVQAEADFRSALAKGGIRLADPSKVPTLANFAPRFLTFSEHEKGVRASTLALYVRNLDSLTGSALAKLPLSKIDSAAFSKYIEERRSGSKRDIGFTAIRRERQVLVSLLRYAKEVGEIENVPIIRTPGKQARRDYIPDEKTLLAYLAAARPLLRDVAILSLSTGMRPGEILGLSLTEVAKTKAGYAIRLLQSKSEMGKKTIYLDRSNAPHACAVLDSRLPHLFTDAPGRDTAERVEKVSKMHGRLRARLKLPAEFVLYSFRHLYITNAAKNTQAHQLRELARHQDLKTTMIYYSPEEAERRKLARGVRLLSGKVRM